MSVSECTSDSKRGKYLKETCLWGIGIWLTVFFVTSMVLLNKYSEVNLDMEQLLSVAEFQNYTISEDGVLTSETNNPIIIIPAEKGNNVKAISVNIREMSGNAVSRYGQIFFAGPSVWQEKGVLFKQGVNDMIISAPLYEEELDYIRLDLCETAGICIEVDGITINSKKALVKHSFMGALIAAAIFGGLVYGKKYFIRTIKRFFSVYSIPIILIHYLINVYSFTMIYNISKINKYKYYLYCFFTFINIFILWNLIFYIKKNYTLFGKTYKVALKKMLYLGIINFGFLLLMWPGIWRWDDIGVLTLSVKQFEIDYWQSLLTNLLYFFSLSLLPFPSGIIIIQIFIISLIIGYISAKFLQRFGKKAYIFELFMLLPAMITNNLYPMRAVLYGYVMLLLFIEVIMTPILNYKKAIMIGILSSIIATWRSEGIIFLLFVPLWYILTNSKNKKVVFVLVMILLCGFKTLSSLQPPTNSGYIVTAILEPLDSFVKNDFKSDDKKKDLEIIDNVLSVDMMQQAASSADVFWNGGLRNTDKESVNELIKVYVKIIVFNFPDFVKERLYHYALCNGIGNGMLTLGDTTEIFNYSENHDTYIDNIKYLFNTTYPLVNLGFQEERGNIIKLLECRTFSSYKKTTFLSAIFYNSIPISILIMYIFIVSILKKHKKYFYWCGVYLISLGSVIATAPETLFMYYFPVYVTGIGVSFLYFVENAKCKQKNR